MSSELKKNLFRKRLEILIGKERPFAWAARMGISKGAFSRIWNQGTIPSSPLLLQIAESTGVSLNWLLAGKEPMFLNASRSREKAVTTIADRHETERIAEVNPILLESTICLVEKYLRDRKLELPPAKKAELIVFLYSDFSGSGAEESVREERTARIIKLFAS